MWFENGSCFMKYYIHYWYLLVTSCHVRGLPPECLQQYPLAALLLEVHSTTMINSLCQMPKQQSLIVTLMPVFYSTFRIYPPDQRLPTPREQWQLVALLLLIHNTPCINSLCQAPIQQWPIDTFILLLHSLSRSSSV